MTRYSLRRRLLLSYCTLVLGLLLVLGFTIIPAQLNRMDAELDAKISWAAALLSEDAQIKEALAAGEPNADLTGRLDTLMQESQSLGYIDYIVVARTDGIRIYHPDHSRIGQNFAGGDEVQAASGGQPYITTGQGQNARQRRAFHAISDENGQPLGFVMVSTMVTTIRHSQHVMLLQFGLIFAAALAAGIGFAFLISHGIRQELLGYEPEAFANLYLQGEEALRASTHEFLNKLHVISGLLQMGEIQQAIAYLNGVKEETQEGQQTILHCIGNHTIAALLLGKESRARELDIHFSLRSDSHLQAHSPYLHTRDLVTVVGNLIENAFDAVKPQELRQVELYIGESENGLIITVDDTGYGMTKEQIEKVKHGKFTTKGRGHGTGLRLIRQIVSTQQGYLEIESEPGEGSSFTVSFDKPHAQEGGTVHA